MLRSVLSWFFQNIYLGIRTACFDFIFLHFIHLIVKNFPLLIKCHVIIPRAIATINSAVFPQRSPTCRNDCQMMATITLSELICVCVLWNEIALWRSVHDKIRKSPSRAEFKMTQFISVGRSTSESRMSKLEIARELSNRPDKTGLHWGPIDTDWLADEILVGSYRCY